MKSVFLSEMGFAGKIPRNHTNMRTEFAWMCALDAEHENIGKYEVPGSDLGFYDPDEYPEFYEDGPEEEDRDGPVIEQIIAANQVIEERDETDIFDIWDRIKAKQAQRALLVEKGIIQDNSEIPQTKEAMMLNSGGLANLFRVKTQ